MNTQLKIDGMTCGHCVAGVTKALQQVPGVQLASVSLDAGSASVTHDETASAEALVAAVQEEGYEAQLLSDSEQSRNEASADGAACSCCAPTDSSD